MAYSILLLPVFIQIISSAGRLHPNQMRLSTTNQEALFEKCTTSINNAASVGDLQNDAAACFHDLITNAKMGYAIISNNLKESGNYMYSSTYWWQMVYDNINSLYYQEGYFPNEEDLNAEEFLDENLADAKETVLRIAGKLFDQFTDTFQFPPSRSSGRVADLKNELMCPELEVEGFRPYYNDVPGYNGVQVYYDVSVCTPGYVKNEDLGLSNQCLRCANIQGKHQWFPMSCYGSTEQYMSYYDESQFVGGTNDYCVPMETTCSVTELQDPSFNAILLFYPAGFGDPLTGYHDGCKAGTWTADNFNPYYNEYDNRAEIICDGSNWVVQLIEVSHNTDTTVEKSVKREISLQEFDKLACVADGDQEETTTEETSTHAPIDVSAYVNKGRKCTMANADRMRQTFEEEFYALPSCLTVTASDDDGDGNMTFMATCDCGCEDCSQELSCDTVTTTSGREIFNIVRVNRFFEFLEVAGNCCAGCGCCD